MSETTAILLITTVSPVTRRGGLSAVGSVALAVSAAELARRLLSPRSGTLDPAPVELGTYFTEEEIDRGTRYARPQLALALARGAVDAVALVLLVRTPPAILRRRSDRPALDGAAAGAMLSIAMWLPSLPLAAVARRRAISVGLVTQSWRGWAIDLVEASLIQGTLTGAAGGAMVLLMHQSPHHWWITATA